MTQHTQRLPTAIFLLLCGFYLLTMSGHSYSPDEETMLAVTDGLLARGDVAVLAEDGAPLAALRPGLGGRGYSPYGVLPSLLALPLYGIGEALGGGGAATEYAARFLVGMLNAPVTAATAALLAAWALRLGARRAWAVGLALLYGLGTFAWPYARTFFSEPLAGLLLLLAAERADAAGDLTGQARRGALLACGLAGGLLLATRIAAGVALPAIGLYVLWGALRRCRSAGQRGPLPALFDLLPFALGLLPGLALLAWYNLARFGTPLASGYASESELFTTPMAVGLYGLLLSPGKSLLLFAPPLLLALPGGALLWRRGRASLALLCAGLLLSHLLLYAMWGEWQGGGVWGPRFLLPALAVGMLPAAALGAGAGRLARPALAAALALGLVGFAGNLGGALLNFNTYLNSPGGPDKVYSLTGSPLLAHWRILAGRWGRALAAPPACALGDGWHPSEASDGAALPRRGGALGLLTCRAPAESRVALSLDDRRPPEAPPSGLRIRLNGRDLGAIPAGQLRSYRLMLPASARLEIAATTWNPLAAGFSPRDDELGPQLSGLRGVTPAGQPVAVVDTAVAPLPARPRPRWAWYYDPPNQHLADLWIWHLPRSELAGPRAWLLGGLLLLLGASCLGAGARLLAGGATAEAQRETL